jgi:hypothetical protein
MSQEEQLPDLSPWGISPESARELQEDYGWVLNDSPPAKAKEPDYSHIDPATARELRDGFGWELPDHLFEEPEPAPAPKPEPKHVHTEVRAMPGGGVAIRVFFRRGSHIRWVDLCMADGFSLERPGEPGRAGAAPGAGAPVVDLDAAPI